MAQDQNMDRRRFFRAGLRELLKPLVKAVDPVAEAARQLGTLEEKAAQQGGQAMPPKLDQVSVQGPGVARRTKP